MTTHRRPPRWTRRGDSSWIIEIDGPDGRQEVSAEDAAAIAEELGMSLTPPVEEEQRPSTARSVLCAAIYALQEQTGLEEPEEAYHARVVPAVSHSSNESSYSSSSVSTSVAPTQPAEEPRSSRERMATVAPISRVKSYHDIGAITIECLQCRPGVVSLFTYDYESGEPLSAVNGECSDCGQRYRFDMRYLIEIIAAPLGISINTGDDEDSPEKGSNSAPVVTDPPRRLVRLPRKKIKS